MKKYEVINSYSGVPVRIREFQCEKETEKSIWIMGKRRAKRSSYENYFDTWEEAHNMLIVWQKDIINSLRLRLEEAKGRLGNIKGMKQ